MQSSSEKDPNLEKTNEKEKNQYYGTTKEHCEEMIKKSLKHNPVVKFMMEALEKSGCPVKKNFFRAEECSMAVGGGFLPGEGVLLCHNYVLFQNEVDVTIVHELIHAYDHCRSKNLDWSDCEHHACSEIRASNLSQACHMHKEILLQGKNFTFRGGHQKCVKRKALLSVLMNPNCSEECAKKSVEKVWNACYKDTSPFEQIP